MRAIWTGSIAFGLVNVPVKVYSATADHDIRFHQVHAKDNGRIRYKRVCEACGEVVDYRDLARAYESGDGQMVAITDDDIASLPEERSREIEVLEFVPAADVDPMMFDRSYFLEPDSKSSKSYVLLAKTLAETDRMAIVHFTLRNKTRLAALRLAGVESAGGVRPDRGYLQPQQRFLAKFGRPHVGEDLQRLHYAVEQSRDPGAEPRLHAAR